MIESVDGRGSFDGRSSALGDAGDKQVFRALRSVCDVVLVGTGTLATEHYGRLVRDADVQAARERHGLAPQPLLCTVTRSGQIPPGIPLLADPDARMVIYSGAAVELGDAAASVEVVTVDPSRLSLASALHDLRVRLQQRLVLCEGGPTVLGQLIGYRALDELFLTFAGKLAGGTGPAIVSGTDAAGPARGFAAVAARAGRLVVPTLRVRVVERSHVRTRASYTNSIELLAPMPGTLTPTDAIEALTEARERTLTLVAGVGDEDLERVHSTLMSPLVWDLGHIAAFEDLWLVHRLGGEPMLRDDLADVYDAFETPRAGRGELPFLRPVAGA